MANSAASQFSIYNFFSVLLPGLIFMRGLYPFLPTGVAIDGLVFLLPILAIAFAIGQLIHILAIGIERILQISSHRDTFIKQFTDATVLSRQTVDEFYWTCYKKFSHIDLMGRMGEDAQDDLLMDTLSVYT